MYRHAGDRADDCGAPVLLIYAFFSEVLIEG